MHRPLLLLAAVLCLATPAAADDCRPTPAVQVALSLPRPGRITVPVSIAGKTFTFAIDTGASNSFLAEGAATTLGLAPQPFRTRAQMHLFGGQRIDHFVEAPDLTLGTLRATGVALAVAPAAALGDGIDGILGGNVLAAYDADFDFAGGKLTLLQPGDCPEAFWSAPGRVVVPFTLARDSKIDLTVQLDGKDVDAWLDSGAMHVVLEKETAQGLFGVADDDPRLKLAHVTNGRDYYTFPFKTLAIGTITFPDPPVYLMPRADSHDTNQRMLFSVGLLHGYRMLIAYRQQKLYLAPPPP